uniref:condensation domain-containing protein n=1 Tax=Aquiflexum sp. TaxID=1872584 RepID=UPI0035937D56
MPLTKSQITPSATEVSFLINSYWIKKLEGIEELQLPKDHSKSLTKGTENNTIYFQIEKSLLENIITHFSESKPAPSLILLAALKVLLYRYSNQIDFFIGTTCRETVPEIPTKNGVKNVYLDLLPIGTKIDDTKNFGDFVKKLGVDLIEANSNNQIFVDQLISLLGKKNEKELRLLYPVIFDYQNTDLVVLNRSSKIALEKYNSSFLFGFVENDEKIEGCITFDKEFISYETLNRMVSHYATLLESIHSHPSLNLGFLNFVPKEERTLLLETLNATEAEYPHEKTIVDLFEEQVKNNPDAIAIEFEGNQLTYSELDSKSNQLAHYLKKIGINSEDPVPI